MTERKARNTNLELYRIIAMFLIVAHHYVVNSDVMPLMTEDGFTVRSLFYYLFGMWGKIGINCFVLITGYFMCKSKISLKKFLKLFIEIEFYFVSIYFLFVVTGYISFSFSDFFDSALWFMKWHIGDSFTNCFMFFWLFIPFLNILIRNLNKKQHGYLVLLTLGIYTFLGSIPGVGITFNYVSWFSVLFILASYLRNYPSPSILSKKYVGWFALASVILAMLSVIAMRWLSSYTSIDNKPYFFVIDSNKLLALLVAVTSFCWFKDLKIPYIPFINIVASTTFGVFLIHTSGDTMRRWLWNDIVDVAGHFSMDHYIFYSLVVVIMIFVVCSIIDIFRQRTLEKWVFKRIDTLFR